MRRLTFIVLILAAIYGGYWVVGSRAVTNGASSALTQLQAEGWLIDVSDVSTKGFPSRFDTTLSDVTLVPPTQDWRYSAPFVQALALSYAPNEVIAVLPATQTLELVGQTLSINSDRLRASTGVSASTDLSYQGFTAEGDKLEIKSTLDWGVRLERLLSAMRPAAEGPTTYDLYTELLEIELLGLSSTSQLPDIQRITADMVVTLNKQLNRTTFQSVETDLVLPTALTLKNFTLLWGEVGLRANGSLDIPAGVPEGRIDVAVTNWETLQDVLVENGIVDADLAETYGNIARLLSNGSANLELPISFKNGSMSVGPLPLGPAPRFY